MSFYFNGASQVRRDTWIDGCHHTCWGKDMRSIVGSRVRITLSLAFPLLFRAFHSVVASLLSAYGLLRSKSEGTEPIEVVVA